MVVIHPLDSSFKDSRYVLKYLISIVVSITVLSVFYTFIIQIFHQNIPSQLCSPFLNPVKTNYIAKSFLWLIVIIQCVAAMSIITLYFYLIRELKKSQEKLKKAISQKQSNFALLFQLIIITVSNLLCWLPSSSIYLMTKYAKVLNETKARLHFKLYYKISN